MPAPLFILRAHWAEDYDCPDNGPTKICDTYEDLYISSDRLALEAIAEDLRSAYRGGNWDATRHNELRKLHANWDDYRETTYTVHDVSALILA